MPEIPTRRLLVGTATRIRNEFLIFLEIKLKQLKGLSLLQDEERPLQAHVAYVFSHTISESLGQNRPIGGSFGVGRDLMRDDMHMRSFGWVGEFRGSHHSDTQTLFGRSITSSDSLKSFFGGPRFQWTGSPIRPYVIGEAGWSRWSFSQDYGNSSFSDSENAFGFLVQGGISKKINMRTSVYAGFSYGRRWFSSPLNSWEVEGGFDDFCPICWLKGHGS